MNNQAYAFDVELDNENFYINTILKNGQWIPVIGRKARVGDDDFFVFVAKNAQKSRNYVYLMPMLGSEVGFKTIFKGDDELSQFVINTLVKLKTAAVISSNLTGDDSAIRITNDKPVDSKPVIIKISGSNIGNYAAEMQKILNIQDKAGEFLQRI